MPTAEVRGAGELIASFDQARQIASASDTWVVGTNVKYAVYVELGTYKMEAQPYLRPAVRHALKKADSIAERVNDPDELIRALAFEIEAKAVDLVPVDTGNLQASIRAEKL